MVDVLPFPCNYLNPRPIVIKNHISCDLLLFFDPIEVVFGTTVEATFSMGIERL